MNILVLNGSPHGEHSNSLRLTHAFLEGMKTRASIQYEIVPVSQLNIRACLGCCKCWYDTPGICCIKDDMAQVLKKMMAADAVIWSFPLYFFGLPSGLKALMDRQLPMVLPFMIKRDGSGPDSGSHPIRYEEVARQRYILISTCGFYTAEHNYDAVNSQFDRCYGKGNYERIYCGQGGGQDELFESDELFARANEYLAAVRTAGAEYMEGGITPATRKKLSELLLSRDEFERRFNASWPEQSRDRCECDRG